MSGVEGMDKNIFDLTQENLLKLGIDPCKGIEYLQNKDAATINPIHVHAIQFLKQKPAVASS